MIIMSIVQHAQNQANIKGRLKGD